MDMEEYSDYKAQMIRQEQNLQARSLVPQSNSSCPWAQKSVGTLFGPDTNHYAVSSLCNRLNQHLPNGKKLDPSVPRLMLLSTIQTMENEGYLPDDKILEDVLLGWHVMDNNEVTSYRFCLPIRR